MRLHSAQLFLFIVAALIISACGHGGSGPLGAANRVLPVAPAAQDTTLKRSWMAHDAAALDLLYVSNAADGTVDVYSYPGEKLKGRLPGVHTGGICSDARGNVYVPDGNQIAEYAHGNTKPAVLLDDPLGGSLQFCSVDPSTGNLAVSGGAPGTYGIALYAKGTGVPHPIVARSNNRYWACTFDRSGNLFVQIAAANSKSGSNLVELPSGATQLRKISWNAGRDPGLGSLHWEGRYLVTQSSRNGSQQSTMLHYNISGLQATPVSETIADSGSPENSYAALSLAPVQKVAVVTYHYNNLRTGWNNAESTLTAQNVSAASFGLLHTVALDDQVDTQPLLVPNETTTRGVSPGIYDVVYVATESNTIYAVDAASGTILFEQNLGTPVSSPLGCNNNGPNVGIDGTPVIDLNANAMYVIAYTMQGNVPTYMLHELNLSNLSDIAAPVVVSASHTLSNGNTFTFHARYQRQRPGLLEANGNIYAGFGSFCDFSASRSRGWVLGWQAGTLTPLAANRLNDTLYTSPNSFFLSSVWMSGYGLAADQPGNIYFATGNSDPSGTTYNSVTNLAESIVKVSPDLSTVLSFFTPANVDQLDINDEDTGSGGVLLLPQYNGSGVPLAAAAGKAGVLFLMNRNSLGGYTPGGPNNDLAQRQIGGCWCGQSYFDAASDSIRRIVASGGNNVTVWKVLNPPAFAAAGSSATLPGNQDPGFFTTVSSNGSNPGAIIWALARPQSVPGGVTLFAFSAEPSAGSTLQTLYKARAGSWQTANGNANLVPVVANGQVYVASYKQLNIFGLLGAAKTAPLAAPPVFGPAAALNREHAITGTLVTAGGAQLLIRTRAGTLVRIDASPAIRAERSAVLVLGGAYTAEGTYVAGVFHATIIVRAKPSPQTWPADI